MSPSPEELEDDQPADSEALSFLQFIASSVIGLGTAIPGPFGDRPLTYADYTASGRSLSFVEDIIRNDILPSYGNTHTEASYTGFRTTVLREEARQLIRSAVGGDSTTLVIFTGSGSTGAIDKFISLLGLKPPLSRGGSARPGSFALDPQPVVFIGPYEHHSNDLSWRESLAEVVRIRQDRDGVIDQDQLRRKLINYHSRPLLIGSFSAASNVTGILSEIDQITRLLHEHGALACWDFAAAGPYIDISMVPQSPGADPRTYKDAVFLSPHKLVGGPGTPGVLAIRREHVTSSDPVTPGGGTVQFVSAAQHDFVEDLEQREEGGTPAIIESIRAGLAFGIRQRVGTRLIRQRESQLVRQVMQAWTQNPAIEILGNLDAERLAIFSFLIRPIYADGASGRYLHHNFVVALLNDLFGIQARGGCSCAGPYGHELLRISAPLSLAYRQEILSGYHGIKPGWARVNFNYFFPEEVTTYIIDAVSLIASDGWRLLPLYRFTPATGIWRHSATQSSSQPRLADLLDAPLHPSRPSLATHTLSYYLQEAARIISAQPELAYPPRTADIAQDALTWFELPEECLALPNMDAIAER